MKNEKFGSITFRYFLKGDKVTTPDGEGVVIKDESPISTDMELICSDILIQHKEGLSGNPENRPILMDRLSLIREKKENEDTD